jgi:hypothetical protein
VVEKEVRLIGERGGLHMHAHVLGASANKMVVSHRNDPGRDVAFFARLPHRVEGLLPDEIGIQDFRRTLRDFPELRNGPGSSRSVRIRSDNQRILEVRYLEKLLRLFPDINVAATVSAGLGEWIHRAVTVEAAEFLKYWCQFLKRIGGFGFLSHDERTDIFRPLNERGPLNQPHRTQYSCDADQETQPHPSS